MGQILPPCTDACPVHTDVRGYLAAITRRDYREAYRLIRAGNPFPSVCAWVCHHPCEDACRRAGVDAPLSIRDLKRFVVEAVDRPATGLPRATATGKKVAVVGAGPAGLTAAYDLVHLGHRAVVYDRLPAPGGQFLTSLPTYSLPREVLRRDVEEIMAAGVEIHTGTEIGKDILISRLQEEYDAVIISAGLWAERGLPLPGFGHPCVLLALPLLKAANAGVKPGIGNCVIVIGGGDVAMDVARTALRLGATDAKVVCLESRDRMPAHIWEIEDALAEGVKLFPGFGPMEVMVKGGAITGLAVRKVKTVFDRDGRFNPSFEPGAIETIPGDTVILAIGRSPDNSFLVGSNLKTGAGGCLVLDKRILTTNVEGVFACGELAEGPGPAIAAVASGHRVATVVDHYLKGEKTVPQEQETTVIGPLPVDVAEKTPRCERCQMPALTPGERKNSFMPYKLGLDEPAALYEASRCLSCGLGATVIDEKCAACLTCRRVCPYGVPVVTERAGIPAESCLACGICAATCPAGAITVGVLNEEKILGALDSLSLDANVAVFACRGTCAGNPGLVGAGKTPALARARIVQVPTAGAVRLEWLLKAIENGAAGVAIVACGNGQCRFAGGAAPLDEVISRARGLLSRIGIPPERLYCCQPGEGEDPVVLLTGFVKELP